MDPSTFLYVSVHRDDIFPFTTATAPIQPQNAVYIPAKNRSAFLGAAAAIQVLYGIRRLCVLTVFPYDPRKLLIVTHLHRLLPGSFAVLPASADLDFCRLRWSPFSGSQTLATALEGVCTKCTCYHTHIRTRRFTHRNKLTS